MSTDLVITLLSVLTLLGQLFIILSFVFPFSGKKPKFAYDIFSRNNILFAFIIALLSMLGSLFLSEIANLPPCELCWIQRFFMYPLVAILAVAYLIPRFKSKIYVLSLSIAGLLFAAYHYYIQMFSTSSFCSATDGVSCLLKSFTKFGYITIPLMAFTAFAMIIVLFTVYDKKK